MMSACDSVGFGGQIVFAAYKQMVPTKKGKSPTQEAKVLTNG